jgi:ribosome-associated protein
MNDARIDPCVPDSALDYQFVRARGTGGQHVNKVSTAVQLKVHLGRTQLPESVKARLRKLAGSRLTGSDEVLIFADRYRSQLRNKQEATERFLELLERARRTNKKRIETRPSRSQKRARLDRKKRQGSTKKLRGKPTLD